MLNLQIAKAYLPAPIRVWPPHLAASLEALTAANRTRINALAAATKDKAFDLIRHQVIIETQAEIFESASKDGFDKHLSAPAA